MSIVSPKSPVMVRALQRGLDILDCLAAASQPETLTYISEYINVSMPTASRILGTLEERGYVERNEATKRYSLGNKCFYMHEKVLQRPQHLRNAALPHLQALAKIFDESVSLYIAVGNQRVCLERIECSRALRTAIVVGDQIPLEVGAGGRALLAWMTEAEQKNILGDKIKEMQKLLAQTKKEGCAVSCGEREEGISAVAAPVFGPQQRLLASLSVAGPSTRFTQELIPQIIEAVVREADALSKTMQKI